MTPNIMVVGKNTKEMTNMKDELSHVKLQASLAQTAAEEALETANNVDIRVGNLEQSFLGKDDIVKLIEQTIKDSNTSIKAGPHVLFFSLPSNRRRLLRE